MYQFSIALDDLNSCTCGIANWEVKDGFFGADLAAMTPAQAEDARDLLIRKLSRVVLYTTDLPVSDYVAYVRFFRNAHLLGIVNVCLSNAAVAGASDDQIRRVIAIGASFSIGVLFRLEAEYMDSFGFERYAALRGRIPVWCSAPTRSSGRGSAPTPASSPKQSLPPISVSSGWRICRMSPGSLSGCSPATAS